jgi:hypothetical protein
VEVMIYKDGLTHEQALALEREVIKSILPHGNTRIPS